MFKIENLSDLRCKVGIIEENVKILIEENEKGSPLASVSPMYQFKIDTLEQEIKKINTALHLKKQDINKALTAIAELKKKISDSSGITNIENCEEIESLKSKLSTFVKKFDYDTLNTKVAKLKSDLEADYVTTQKFDQETNSLSNDSTRLKGQIIDLKTEIDQLKSDIETDYVTTQKFDQETNSLSNDSTRLKGQIIDLKAEIDQLKSDIEADYVTTQKFDQETNSLSSVSTRLKGQIDDLKAKTKSNLGQLKADIEADYVTTQKFDKEIKLLSDVSTRLKVQIDDLKTKIPNLEIQQFLKDYVKTHTLKDYLKIIDLQNKLPKDHVKLHTLKEYVKLSDLSSKIPKDYVTMTVFSQTITDNNATFAKKTDLKSVESKIQTHSNQVSKDDFNRLEMEVKNLATTLKIFNSSLPSRIELLERHVKQIEEKVKKI
jgi:chromosome segregation ATPase